MTTSPGGVYVILAGLAWGTYVPLIFFGGTELTTRPGTIGGRLASILCVGVAYFVLAVLIPVVLMSIRDDAKPEWKTNGLVFSGLAGVAGAVGAICVIFASKAAVDAAKIEGVNPATYRIYIAPLIFGLAPAINTLVSLVWHPKTGRPVALRLRNARLEAARGDCVGRARHVPGADVEGRDRSKQGARRPATCQHGAAVLVGEISVSIRHKPGTNRGQAPEPGSCIPHYSKQRSAASAR